MSCAAVWIMFSLDIIGSIATDINSKVRCFVSTRRQLCQALAALMTEMRDGTNRNHSFVGLQSLCAVPWHKQCLRCGDPSVPCSVHVTTPPIRSHFILLAVTLPFCRSVCLSARLSLSLSVCSLYTHKQPLSRSHTPEIIEVFARGMLHLLQRMVGK